MMSVHGKLAARYFLVGGSNTVLYTSLLWVFLSKTEFPYAVSIGLSFVGAMCFQYCANKYFTFGVKSASFGEIGRYLASAAINYSVSVFVVWICLDIINASALLASLVSALCAAIAGYFLSFFWVYRR